MNVGRIMRRAAIGVGTLGVTGTLVLGGSGIASAETTQYQVRSGSCVGNMMTGYVSGGGGWQVRNYVDNSNGGVTCSGWMDWAEYGDTNHFYGLQNRIWVDPHRAAESTYLPDNSPALTRVCVQANNDGTARCTPWY